MSSPNGSPRISTSPGVALHRQIYLVLKDEISHGLYSARMLPNEEGLCERFGVSRITIRRALSDLANNGIVERKHGRGTYVLWEPSLASSALSLELIDTLNTSALESLATVIELTQILPPEHVRLHLKLSIDVIAVRAQRLRMNRRGDPAYLTDTWVSFEHGKFLTNTALNSAAAYEILGANGVSFGRVIQEFGATVSNPDTAELLKVEVGSPVLKVSRLMHDKTGNPVLFLTSYLPADRGMVLMEADGGSINTLQAGQIVLDLPNAT